MNLKKRVIEGGVVAVSLAILSAVTAISGTPSQTNVQDATKVVEDTSNEVATIEKNRVDLVMEANADAANILGVGVNAEVAAASTSEQTTDLTEASGAVGANAVIAAAAEQPVQQTETAETTEATGAVGANAVIAAAVEQSVQENEIPGIAASVGVNAEAAVVSATTDAEQAEDVAESTQDEAGDTEDTSEDQAQDGKEEESEKNEDVWSDRLMAKVEESLNVRAAADDNAEVIGKLYKGAVAEAREVEGDWTHIISGNVDGYVKNDYCVKGEDAEAYAQENFKKCATVNTDILRIRDTADEEGVILDVAKEGAKLTVDTDAEEENGWVAINYNEGQTAYVSSDYVTVDYDLTRAVTMEEEYARIKAEEEAKAAEEAAKAAQAAARAAEEASAKAAAGAGQQQSSPAAAPTTVQNAPAQASCDDVTMLGALIQLEAGGEPYEGQVAVGAVVMNRVRNGAYPGSISGVIYQSGQFSTAGGVAGLAASGVSGSCLQAAQAAIGGTDNTGGALNFRRAGGINGLIIGNHVFF